MEKNERKLIQEDIDRLIEYVTNTDRDHGCEHPDMILLGNAIGVLKAKNEYLRRRNNELKSESHE
ncbi:hypothetical protein [Parabacteroides sp. Marseille-P3160]|uniref:hypothetical protein n=1 Tax=Parabacteroides sp. Marseille-P3160 TaxID=1917887 RepID=UPI0009B965FD|nr:hypothetical protein [Parabacteroides sp. Marseille-P3160]